MVRLLVFMTVLASALFGQVGSSTLTGRVSDASGAAIPGVAIRIVNQDSGAAIDLVTNHEGSYTASALLPGTYRVEARAAGFDPLVRKGVELAVVQSVAADFTLQVGGQNQTVEVTGDLP